MSPGDGTHNIEVIIPGTITIEVQDGKVTDVVKQRLFDGLMSVDPATAITDGEAFRLLEETYDGEWPGWDWS
jgi:hypothetical protein